MTKINMIKDATTATVLYAAAMALTAVYQINRHGYTSLTPRIWIGGALIAFAIWWFMTMCRRESARQDDDARQQYLDKLAAQCQGADLEPEIDLAFEITEPDDDLEWID